MKTQFKTWHFESATIALLLASTTMAWGGGDLLVDQIRARSLLGHPLALAPWAIALGRWFTFGAMSIGNRIAERAALRARWASEAGVPNNEHEVECANQLLGHVVVGQLLAAAAQVATGALDGLIIGLAFAVYVPVWRRRVWRVLHPYAPARPDVWKKPSRRVPQIEVRVIGPDDGGTRG